MEGKYIVAAVGIGAAAAIEIVNVIFNGPDAAVATAVVATITTIAGWALGRRGQQNNA